MTLAIKSLGLFKLICDYPYIVFSLEEFYPLDVVYHARWG